jgi:hypothetical protein
VIIHCPGDSYTTFGTDKYEIYAMVGRYKCYGAILKNQETDNAIQG